MAWPENVLIIAEISCNHVGDHATALKLVDAAAEAGADAVKFQLYKPETMTLDLRTDAYMVKEGPWKGMSLWELYGKAMTPWEWMPDLKVRAESLGLKFIVSVYDKTAQAYAETLKPWAYKVASFEAGDLQLLTLVARLKHRVIVSLGMADEEEIDGIADLFWCYPEGDLILLHCVTQYPASPETMRLSRIPRLHWLYGKGAFIGLSDHSLSPMVPALAVAAGARVIEKHFTLDRGNGSQDAAFSLELKEFAEMARNIRWAEACMGGASTAPNEYARFKRSLCAVAPIAEGGRITEDNTRMLRRDGGAYDIRLLLGKAAKRPIALGEPIKEDDVK